MKPESTPNPLVRLHRGRKNASHCHHQRGSSLSDCPAAKCFCGLKFMGAKYQVLTDGFLFINYKKVLERWSALLIGIQINRILYSSY
jgi:hypothetical protein